MRYNKLEYNVACFLSSVSLFLGIGFNRIIQDAGSDSLISIVIGFFIGLFIIWIMKRFDSKEIKVLKFIYSFVLLGISIFLITNMISSIYLNNTPDFIVMVPYLILLYYVITNEKNMLFRVCSILFYLYVIIAAVPIFTLGPNINVDHFMPMFSNETSNILYSAFKYAIISTSPLILFPDFKDNYSYKTYVCSSILTLIIFAIVIGNLGVDLAKIYRYPEYMVFKNIALLGFIENIQNILSYLWIISSFTVSSFASYSIKEVTSKKVFLGLLIVILIVFCKIFLNNYIYTQFLINYYIWILGGCILLYIISKFCLKNKN